MGDIDVDMTHVSVVAIFQCADIVGSDFLVQRLTLWTVLARSSLHTHTLTNMCVESLHMFLLLLYKERER